MTSLDVRAIDETELKKAPRPKTKHELQVFLSEEAFDRAVERGAADTTREIGGVLVGEVLRDDGGPYLRIDATIDALHAEEKGAELTFTHATWEHIHKEMDTTYKGKKVVGWYHTHPGFGVFLSDRDQFIHNSFFNLPFQVALVYDPKSKEHGVFVWRDNEVWRMRRYAIGAREHTWDGNRTTARPADDKKAIDDKKKARDDDRDDDRDRDRPRDGDDSLLGTATSFALIALLLVAIAGFVGFWFGSSSSNKDMLQSQLALLHAQEQGKALMIQEVQHDLVDVLRDTMSDDEVRRPIALAITTIDEAIATLEGVSKPAAPAAPAPAPAPGAGSGSAAPAPAPAAAPAGDRVATAIANLRDARATFATLLEGRTVAMAFLDSLERETRESADDRRNVVHDISVHRAAIGNMYAQLALDVFKTDKVRAHQLLQTAVLVDPSNRMRYLTQLQTFEKGGTLPLGSSDTDDGVTP